MFSRVPEPIFGRCRYSHTSVHRGGCVPPRCTGPTLMPSSTISIESAADSISQTPARRGGRFAVFSLCWMGNYFGGMISTLLAAYLPDTVFDLIGGVDAAALSEIGSYVGALYLVGWS